MKTKAACESCRRVMELHTVVFYDEPARFDVCDDCDPRTLINTTGDMHG